MKKRWLLLLILIAISTNAFAQSKHKIKFRETDTINAPQQIDCQNVITDESYLGGTKTRNKICFYDVIIGQDKHVMMWKDIKTGVYGFTNMPLDK